MCVVKNVNYNGAWPKCALWIPIFCMRELSCIGLQSTTNTHALTTWQVVIQPSSRRAYTISEYRKAGAVITDDLSEADAIVGVCI